MIYIDDSILKKGCPATAGSKILSNFTAPFDATVISRLSVPGCDKIQMTALGEFGMTDPGELPGTPLLCNDIFGQLRTRAARQGLCYIRPTYGTVSRYGLIASAASMDQIGIVCKNPKEGFSLLSAIAGFDENDGAMFPEKTYSYKADAGKIIWGAIGSSLKNIKAQINAVDCNKSCFDAGEEVLFILAYAEICNNINRFDGIKFGYRTPNYRNLEELYTKTRNEGFGPEAKLAAIMGSMVLSKDYYDKYYDKAMRIRRIIKESLDFKQYSVIALPVESPLAVLAGLPSLTFSHNGGGIQLAANVKMENVLIKAWEEITS